MGAYLLMIWKRLKAAEADSKLKQVYIPTYTKPNPNQIMAPGTRPGMNGSAGFQKVLSCESCHTAQSPQWYAWGPPSMQCRLCASCWIYWKKYGGLKTPTQLDGAARASMEAAPRVHMSRQEAQGMSPFNNSAGRAKLLAKNRQTFILQTTKLSRVARRVCHDVLQPRRAARRPYVPINSNAVKAECMIRLSKPSKAPVKAKTSPRPDLATIPCMLLFGSRLPALSPPPSVQVGGAQLSTNGRPFTSGMRTTSQSVIKRQKVNQGDSPTPVVFVATKYTRSLRKALTQTQMRRAARKPHLPLTVKVPPPPPAPPAHSSEPIVLED
ncbi:hypothetical protein JZ751_026941 [Albula glossodonta]|uniref:GATA-type domain-containing protein n=1 Tax=Albula glossodonta TaxID=121402 RepID=A0A8T2NGZ6_9TELE|nr:hypothetical protein JZ751_026941 [Albula glossodonta]